MSNKQETLFEDEQKRRTRKVETFVRTKSRDGSLSVTIDPDIAIKLRRFCRTKNLNCKKVVEEILREKIEALEAGRFDGMDKDSMIDYIRRLEAEKEADA